MTQKSNIGTLIAANWKMHGDLSWSAKPSQLRALLDEGESKLNPSVELLICPPSYLLLPMSNTAKPHNITIGAQDCHFEQHGAFTGEMSADMVVDTGAKYSIIGHSERRAMFGDTDEIVNKKSYAAQSAGLSAILCVGESEAMRKEGKAEEIVGAQLFAGLGGNDGEIINPEQLVIAYEPIWAIGTGLVPTIADIDDMHKFIRAQLVQKYGQAKADKIQILYGGSVKPTNAEEILALVDVNGALIGGAGLKMDSLAAIALLA